jgi:indole-3-glycerol phosphate synthase
VSVPVLRKDFILDEAQLVESRLLGADVILLIVAILDAERCTALCEAAHQLGLEVLVEVHSEDELAIAVSCGADVIGINNRNLSTFETDLATTEQLRPLITADCPVITESGIHSPADVTRLQRTSVDGMLIGEYLMRQPDQQQAVAELLAGAVK